MSNAAMYDELDRVVSVFIENPGDAASCISTQGYSLELRELLEVAAELECVARPEFKAQLEADLLDEIFVAGTSGGAASCVSTPDLGEIRNNGNGRHGAAGRPEQALPSLFGNAGIYSVQRKNFAASALLHATALGLLIVSSTWMAQRAETPKPHVSSVLTDVGVYVSRPELDKVLSGGGASG